MRTFVSRNPPPAQGLAKDQPAKPAQGGGSKGKNDSGGNR